ncbi:MAG: N-acetylmuramic acid 6-phosphate etherase [Rhizobiaceae bacterium]
MSTEYADPRFADLDAWPLEQAVEIMWEGQMAAAAAVQHALPQISNAAAMAADRLGSNGRLIYAGAGTSGRIAVQDGAELGPTFNWPAVRLAFAMAGGERALISSVEDAEDDQAAGAARVAEVNAGPFDVLIGVSASGSTPYTLGAIGEARNRGALTVGLACNPGSKLLAAAEHPVLLETGSEVLAGSTRMKAGTAQKIALNLFSTAIMIRLGGVYKGQMVDMRPTNAKLRIRATNMVADLAGCTQGVAAEALETSGGQIKLAVLVASGNSLAMAQEKLVANGGNLRKALG